MDQIVNILEDSLFFQGLTKAECETLAKFLTSKNIPEGNVVFLENMPGESLYIIKKGAVKISRMLTSGREKTVVVLGADDIFGELALFDDDSRSVSAFVAEDAELLCFHKNDFERLCSENPVLALKISRNMIKLFSQRVRETQADYQKLLKWCLGKNILADK
ncbi:MAG: cyclic nucleotide-binding domain-containing protein [Deltaproteobacteria bacterium]|nr:cyclic nucleotide-binding domain-containing protein [Deltaproteobacteria bacterium]